jgi:hypothetical protein
MLLLDAKSFACKQTDYSKSDLESSYLHLLSVFVLKMQIELF